LSKNPRVPITPHVSRVMTTLPLRAHYTPVLRTPWCRGDTKMLPRSAAVLKTSRKNVINQIPHRAL